MLYLYILQLNLIVYTLFFLTLIFYTSYFLHMLLYTIRVLRVHLLQRTMHILLSRLKWNFMHRMERENGDAVSLFDIHSLLLIAFRSHHQRRQPPCKHTRELGWLNILRSRRGRKV